MTTAPCAAIFGDHSFDTAPPADIRQMSVSGKIEVIEGLHFQRPVPEADLMADAAARRERHDLVGRKGALGEDRHHFAAHIARGADDSDLVTHRIILVFFEIFV